MEGKSRRVVKWSVHRRLSSSLVLGCRPLERSRVDRLTVLAVPQTAMDLRIDRVADQSHRAVAKDEISTAAVWTAERVRVIQPSRSAS